MHFRLASLLLALACLSSFASSSPLVSVSSPLYDLVDRLEAYRCAYATLRGYRPIGGYELLTAAAVDESRHPCVAPEWVLSDRMALVRLPTRIALTQELFFTDDVPTPLLGTESTVFALHPGTRGRPTSRGVNLYSEIALAAQTKWRVFDLSFGIVPGFVGSLPKAGGVLGKLYSQEAYVRVGYSGFELGYGRNELRFGHSPRSGLLFGDASPPIDRIWFGMRPRVLPGFLGIAGPVGFETFVSQDRDRGKGRLFGVQFAMRPLRRFELGLMEVFRLPMTGALTAGDYLALPFTLRAANAPNGMRSTLSLYVALWWFKHRLKTYVQWMGEGERGLRGGSSWLFGTYLVGVLKSELRAEAVFTANHAYARDAGAPPLTYRDVSIGHPIGPGASALYVDLTPPAFSPTLRTDLSLSLEQRNGSYDLTKAIEDRLSLAASLTKTWGATRLKTSVVYGTVGNQKYEEHGTQKTWAVLSKLYFELGGPAAQEQSEM